MSKLAEIEKYWDTRSNGYSKKTTDELKSDWEKWENIFGIFLKDATGKKALDIGCGPGLFTIILAKMGYDMTSVDYSEDMLKEAKKNADENGCKSNFVWGNAQELPFDDGEFDIIVSRNLTWNLEKPEKAYKEWLRVLKTGGIILNYDGNHYRYLYDKEYLLERAQPDFFDGHKPEYIKNIDVSVIDKIAEELPLSGCLRPKWDINFFLEQNVNYTGAKLFYSEFKDNCRIEHRIIKDFILKVVK